MLHKLVKIRHGRSAKKIGKHMCCTSARWRNTWGMWAATSELTLDNAGGGKNWECLSRCNVGNALQCEGKSSGAMQQLALVAMVDNTHGDCSPFHKAWQIHISKDLPKSDSLTVRPVCGKAADRRQWARVRSSCPQLDSLKNSGRVAPKSNQEAN